MILNSGYLLIAGLILLLVIGKLGHNKADVGCYPAY